jgi:hypothetical protein
LIYSLYRNKSSYKVQLINPNKTPVNENQSVPAEQNNTDETAKPKTGLFISLKNVLIYHSILLQIFLKNELLNMVYLQHCSIQE